MSDPQVLVPNDRPSEKEQKYDRQLRLWAAGGQTALENAHVLLVNTGTGVAGVETLKNLVLPGIGQFSILDCAQVKKADLGLNFFLEEDDVDKFRAERTCASLMELNPDVKGHAITEPLETYFTKPDALTPFTFILVVLPIHPEILAKISHHAATTNTPAFYIHSTGFYAHITTQLPQAFPIVDTHPDPTSISDLRLLEPWPELHSLSRERTLGLEQMSDEEHGHVPYVHLLLHYLEAWKLSHGGIPPTDYRDKLEFRNMVQEGARAMTAEGGEENYEEAAGAVLKTLSPHRPSPDVKAVFAATECTRLSGNSSSFWFIASAVSTFYNKHGVLPVSGTLPDMKATSASYVELQNVYKTKARSDVAAVTTVVRQLEKDFQRPSEVDTRDIEAFCKSVAHIKLIRGRPPHLFRPGEDISWGDRASTLVAGLLNQDSLLHIYLAFLAHDAYTLSHKVSDMGDVLQSHKDPEVQQVPTATLLPASASKSATETHSAKTSKTISIAHYHLDSLIKAAGSFIEDPEYTNIRKSLADAVEELLRAEGVEMHNVAAVAGGVAAQEIIKVVTGQYVPVDNMWLYDGIKSVMNVLKT